MDFRLAQPLRGIGGQYTVPPLCYTAVAASCLAMFLMTVDLQRYGIVICSVVPRLQIS